MLENDRVEFKVILSALCESFCKEPSPATFYGYWLALEDLPLADVERAAISAMRDCKFMPSAAELRQLAGVSSASDRALLAWAAVEKVVPLGSYKSVDFFDDPLINATIRNLGGWPFILDKSQGDFDTWIRKDFIAVYQSFLRTGVDGDACRPLAGLGDTGAHDVQKIDGTIHQVSANVVRIETGLPAIGHRQERIACN